MVRAVQEGIAPLVVAPHAHKHKSRFPFEHLLHSIRVPVLDRAENRLDRLR